MHSQICPFCKKEFMPRRDGRSHTFCSHACRLNTAKNRIRENRRFREEMGDDSHPLNRRPPYNFIYPRRIDK